MAARRAQRATVVALAANLVLLVVKGSASNLSDSLAIFSETLNSLADVLSAVVVVLCVRWAHKRPDRGHPFGHRRAEPLAGLVVAIFAGILGFEVCKVAVTDLVRSTVPEHIGLYPIGALVFTVALKSIMTVYFHRAGRQADSPALRATAVDCRNDVLISLQGLMAVAVAEYRLPMLDRVAALVVGLYILYSAHRIGMENIDFLMGRAPSADLVDRIRAAAVRAADIDAIVDIRGHFVGTLIHVELTAVVDGQLSTEASHEVAENIRQAVESLGAVDRVFVHIEPARRALRSER